MKKYPCFHKNHAAFRSFILLACLLTLWACAPTPPAAPTPASPQPGAATKAAYPIHIPQIGQQGANNSTQPAVPSAYPSARTDPAPSSTTQPPAKSFALDSLKNMEFNLPDLPGGKARLQNGMYTGKGPAGTSAEATLQLTKSSAGDLDGNGSEDAVAILVLKTGGTGSFYTLAAVLNEAGGARHAASASLGDRVVVKNISISAGLIRLDMTVHGPNDPLCCPSQNVVRQFRLKANTLEEIKVP